METLTANERVILIAAAISSGFEVATANMFEVELDRAIERAQAMRAQEE